MSIEDDLNAAITSLTDGYSAEHTAVVAELSVLAKALTPGTDPLLTATVTQAIANVTHITGVMATDAAALTNAIPAIATPIQPPNITPPVVPPTATPPVIAVPRVSDPVPPTVTSISPNSGSTAAGQVVTIEGTGFSGAIKVTIGGVAATNVVVNSDTSITATTAAGSDGTASVVVTAPSGLFNSDNTLYTYHMPAPPPPVVPPATP